MRVIITGYGGFVGRHLSDELATATDWRLWGTTWRADRGGPPVNAAVEAVAVDLRDGEAVYALFDAVRPDIVFHLAAQSFVPDAWHDPWGTFETNVRMQLNVLDAALRQAASTAPGGPNGRGPRVVVASTNEVYGAPPPEHVPTGEDAPLAPRNPYATSKAAADLLAGQYALGGADVVRLRSFTHIGPGQDDRFVAASFARQVAEAEAGVGDATVRVGDLTARRDITDVRDIARGYRLAAERGRAGMVYNLGSGQSRMIRDILDHLVANARAKVRIQVDPARLRPSDVAETRCDARRAHAELGWVPAIPLANTLDDILADWRARVAARSNAPATT